MKTYSRDLWTSRHLSREVTSIEWSWTKKEAMCPSGSRDGGMGLLTSFGVQNFSLFPHSGFCLINTSGPEKPTLLSCKKSFATKHVCPQPKARRLWQSRLLRYDCSKGLELPFVVDYVWWYRVTTAWLSGVH